MKRSVLSLHYHLSNSVSHRQVSFLCLLDLTTAFNTVDHSKLIHRLSSWFGLSDTVLTWFSSYVASRLSSIRLTVTHRLSSSLSLPLSLSLSLSLSFGVLCGCVFGPILFNTYTTSLITPIAQLTRFHHLYADDNQLFISSFPKKSTIASPILGPLLHPSLTGGLHIS